jgi:hypothetical protein
MNTSSWSEKKLVNRQDCLFSEDGVENSWISLNAEAQRMMSGWEGAGTEGRRC